MLFSRRKVQGPVADRRPFEGRLHHALHMDVGEVGAFLLEMGSPAACVACAEAASGRCEPCVQKEERARKWRKLRLVTLLTVLCGVCADWLAKS